MGFPADSCREALKRCYGDVQRAINTLVSCGGVLSPLPPLNEGTSQKHLHYNLSNLLSERNVIWAHFIVAKLSPEQ